MHPEKKEEENREREQKNTIRNLKDNLKPTPPYHKNYSLIFIALFALVGGFFLLRSFAASPPPATQTASSNVVPGQLLLRFKASATKAQRDSLIKNEKIDVVKEVPQIGVKVVKVPVNAIGAVQTALSHNPAVDFVEQDRILKPQEQLPNDPSFPQQYAVGGGAWGWYITRTTQAWDITEGSSTVNIAILDTGIKPAGLSDFNGQISSTWNVLNNSSDATTNAGNHGTYVAGVAGLAINNGAGNAGYCPKCKLMIVQVGTDSGASASDIATGLTYAADHGARVANMSWAGPGTSSTLDNAATYAHSKGVVLFAAAGNTNCDCAQFPADSPTVLGVAGVSDSAGDKQGDSNFGTWVKLAAPEGSMTSWPTINGLPGYAAVGGTSIASPAAAGIAGLLFSYNPSLSNTQVEQALESTAAPVRFSIANGRIDALAALQTLGATDPQPSSIPVNNNAPQIYVETNGDWNYTPLGSNAPQVGQVLLRGQGSWTGSAPLSFSAVKWLKCDTNGANCTTTASTTKYTIQATDASSTFKLQVTVSNGLGQITLVTSPTTAVGGAPPSDSTPPTTSITSPANSATVSGNTTVSATASDNVGVTKVEFYEDGVLFGSATASPYSSVLNTTALTNGSHSLTTKAYDATGNIGSSSSISITVNNTVAPATPTGLAPTPLGGSVTLSWNTNTESDLAGYNLQYKPSSGSTWTLVTGITAITYTVSGLTNGTSYDFQVRAVNTTNQVSAWAATVSATPQANTPPDTTPPTATISSPFNGSSIAGLKRVNIAASATDNNVVMKIELYIDGKLTTTVTTTTLNYAWTINKTVRTGSHTILVKAYDAANNIGQSSVTVTK